jgi:deoxyribodipyrimidine photo-lyase
VALRGGGEKAALRRLHHYVTEGRGRLSVYKETRNGMLGADYSSKFSVYLAMGNISGRQVLHAVKEFEGSSGIADQNTYWLIFELLWRDYMRLYSLKYGRKMFYLGGMQGEQGRKKYPWGHDDTLLAKWREGKTGWPIIDANMRELKHTGFMSNRGRQIVASFLVRDLKQDWRHGAEWFESRLLDHDVASNWGNWQYVFSYTIVLPPFFSCL